MFSLRDKDAPLSVDTLTHPWPNELHTLFLPFCLTTLTLARVREQTLTLILIAPRLPKAPWLAEHGKAPSHYTWTSCPKPTGKFTTLVQTGLPSGSGPKEGKQTYWCSPHVFRMRSLYDCKWCVFEEWYEGCKLKSYQFSFFDI